MLQKSILTLVAVAALVILAGDVRTAPVQPPHHSIEVTTTITEIDDEPLADDTPSSPINMHSTSPCNQLALTLAVTPGDSTSVEVRCEERGSTSEGWQPVPFCSADAAASCAKDVRTFTLADYTAVSGVIWLSSRWPIRKQFARCYANDPGDGTGTVDMTGWRSWQ